MESTNGSRSKGSVGWFVQQLGSTNPARTAGVIATVKRKHRLPEAALHAALEEVRAMGPRATNPSGLFIAKLKTYGEERTYAR